MAKLIKAKMPKKTMLTNKQTTAVLLERGKNKTALKGKKIEARTRIKEAKLANPKRYQERNKTLRSTAWANSIAQAIKPYSNSSAEKALNEWNEIINGSSGENTDSPNNIADSSQPTGSIVRG